jgi:hypothetical protein
MPEHRESDLRNETPIERIFRKVVGRNMTSSERICFHLKRRIKPPPRDGTINSRGAKGIRKKMSSR